MQFVLIDFGLQSNFVWFSTTSVNWFRLFGFEVSCRLETKYQNEESCTISNGPVFFTDNAEENTLMPARLQSVMSKTPEGYYPDKRVDYEREGWILIRGIFNAC